MRAQLIADGILGDDAYVVIAGPANTYAHYVIFSVTFLIHLSGLKSYLVTDHHARRVCHTKIRRWFHDLRTMSVQSTLQLPPLASSPDSLTVTLEAYMDIYSKLTGFIADDASGTPPSAPAPPDLTKQAISLQVKHDDGH